MGISDVKAIETVHNGYRFRSRLEARWAVFFDTLGVRYEYEKEGFELSVLDMPAPGLVAPDDPPYGMKHVRYLPDFWLPDYRLWVEIKPGYVPNIYDVQHTLFSLATATHNDVLLLCGSPWPSEYLAFWWTWSERPSEPCMNDPESISAVVMGNGNIAAAYNAARKARFEFGR